MFQDRRKKEGFGLGKGSELHKDRKSLEESDFPNISLDKTNNNIFFSVDKEGNIKHISPQVKFYGFSPEELLSEHFLDLIYPGDRERIKEEFVNTINTGEEHITRFRVRDKEGGIYWFEENSKLEYDNSGRVTGLKGILHDISEFKKAEKELSKFCLSLGELVNTQTSKLMDANLELQKANYKLKEISEKLRESEKEKITILDNIQELVIYQDIDHRILWLNNAAAESVGIDKEEAKGKYCYEVWGDGEEVCGRCPVERTFKTGEVQGGKINSPDGRKWFVKSAPVKDDEDKLWAR